MTAAEVQNPSVAADSADVAGISFSYLFLLIAAFLWGSTNPLMRKGTRKDSSVAQRPESPQISSGNYDLSEVVRGFGRFIFNWKVSVPLVVNQCGSVFFYLGLAGARISFAVPFTNSLTFLFTTLSGVILGESIRIRHIAGMFLVLLGIYFCTRDTV